MLVQGMMQVMGDGGVYNIFLLLNYKHKILFIKILSLKDDEMQNPSSFLRGVFK
jgi:hypothetical protein